MKSVREAWEHFDDYVNDMVAENDRLMDENDDLRDLCRDMYQMMLDVFEQSEVESFRAEMEQLGIEVH